MIATKERKSGKLRFRDFRLQIGVGGKANREGDGKASGGWKNQAEAPHHNPIPLSFSRFPLFPAGHCSDYSFLLRAVQFCKIRQLLVLRNGFWHAKTEVSEFDPGYDPVLTRVETGSFIL